MSLDMPWVRRLERAMDNPLVGSAVIEALMRGWVPKGCARYHEIRYVTRLYRMACPAWMFVPNVLIRASAVWLTRRVRG